jgi:hypothetical protein
VRQLIQLFEQGQRIRTGASLVPHKGGHAVSKIDLIADGPGDDRGMIEVLRDQLPQLLPGVLTKRIRRLQALAQRPLAYQGYLVPEHKSVAVREVVNRLAVLVVGQANAGHPHLTHGRFVRGNVLRFRRPTLAFTILVIADAVYGERVFR